MSVHFFCIFLAPNCVHPLAQSSGEGMDQGCNLEQLRPFVSCPLQTAEAYFCPSKVPLEPQGAAGASERTPNYLEPSPARPPPFLSLVSISETKMEVDEAKGKTLEQLSTVCNQIRPNVHCNGGNE